MDQQNSTCCHHRGPGKAVLMVIMGLVLIVLGTYLFNLSRNAMRSYDYIGKTPDSKDRVIVSGEGKITAAPDVAVLSVGLVTEGQTVNEAQKQNNDKMNSVIKAVKDQFKVEAKDLKTENYSVYPKYNWNNGRQTIIGFTVNQNLQIKVRNFDNIGDIIAKATELGANQVSGPNFMIDDIEKFRAQAREEAIKQAKDKANVLAGQVGIKLGRIVNFSEGGSNYVPVPMYNDMVQSLSAEVKSVAAPQIESGSQDVTVDVSISYEIK